MAAWDGMHLLPFKYRRINTSANQVHCVILSLFFNFICLLWTLGHVYLLPRKSKFQNLNLLKSFLLAWQLLLLCIWPEQDWALQWHKAVVDFRAHHLPHHSWGRPGPDPDLCFSCSSSFLSCKTQAKLLPPLIFLGSQPHWCHSLQSLPYSQNFSICNCSVILSKICCVTPR